MNVTRLWLSGFRNLSELDFSPVKQANVICGNNAQGKTNLIEAIWLFSGAKSFRGAKDNDYFAFGKETVSINLDFYAQGRKQTESIRLGQAQKKYFLNEIPLDRHSAFSGVFQAVVFSPDHMELVKQGPRYRRRLIDESLSQAYPKYGVILDSYEKILKQRAALLDDIPRHPELIDMLEVWDASVVEYGGYITWMRARYVKKLAEYAAIAYEGIASGKESLLVLYRASCGKTDTLEERAQFAALMEKAVRETRGDDLRLGQTSVGPHRDDMEIMVGGNSARTFGSQGQQRSCVLALKLAECRILEESAGEPPVILLDDVMSELDESRRTYLLNHLEGHQTFITCCDPSLLRTLKDGKIFFMNAGILSE